DTYVALELAAVLTLFQALNAILMMFFSVEHRESSLAFWNVFNRYAAFGAGLICVYWFVRGVRGIMLGTLIVESGQTLILVSGFVRERKLRLRSFSSTFFRECVSFGMPLSLGELANVFLNLGDRYLVQVFLGTEAVGLYAAAYNVTGAVQQALSTPLTLAIPPLLMENWQKEGAAGTRRFLSTAMDKYLMLAVPCIVGLSFYGASLIEVFASHQYIRGASVIPLLAMPLILFGGNTIYSAGLFIANRSVALMWISIGSGVANVLLNLLLIPRLGIVGAGVSTLVAYSLAIALLIWRSPAELRVFVHVVPLLKYVAAAAAMTVWLEANAKTVPTLANVSEVVLVAALIYWTVLALATTSVRRTISECIGLLAQSARTFSLKPLVLAVRGLRINHES
ncbi:MAG TPA: oligosaccharide flippase family protein, partial [Terriglobia bacterium]|nr:oligosaccharide flippase family protein [Terriglobia bacterium]